MKAKFLFLMLILAAFAAYWFLRDAPVPLAEASSATTIPVIVDENGPLYFPTPESAVTEATQMMRAKSWKQLARYYDLTGTSIPRATLDSGVFFMVKATVQPQPAPMAELGEREPFVPGFQFISAEPGKEPDVMVVHVGMEIDQGGGPKQKVRSQFQLKKHAQGWLLLPQPAAPAP